MNLRLRFWLLLIALVLTIAFPSFRNNVHSQTQPVLPTISHYYKLEHAANILYDNGNYTGSLFYAKKALVLNPKDPRLLTNMGSIEGELSNFTGALSYYKKALAVDPHHIGALAGVGSVLETLGNCSGATIYFKDAIAQPIANNSKAESSSSANVKFVEVEELERAVALTHLGNYSQAIEIANQILKQNPTNLGGLEIKGVALLYLNNPTAALNIFNTLVSEEHTAAWVLDNRGVALLGLKNYVGAISNFNTAITLDPNDEYAFFNRAEALLNLDLLQQSQLQQQKQVTFKHLDAAIQDLDRGLSINPHDRDALNLKALLTEGLKMGYIRGG